MGFTVNISVPVCLGTSDADFELGELMNEATELVLRNNLHKKDPEVVITYTPISHSTIKDEEN